jgi:hypothetical protein
MWIFTNKSFISVVEHENQKKYKDIMVARARRRKDLSIAFSHAEIFESDESDYRFRCFVTRRDVKLFLTKAVDDIDYVNFKNSIDAEDEERHSYYLRVWAVMNNFQEGIRKYMRRSLFFDRYKNYHHGDETEKNQDYYESIFNRVNMGAMYHHED